MDAVTLDAQIDRLEEFRLQIAALGQTLAERELDAHVLRLTIETELCQRGMTQTRAETEAKAEPRYLAHARQSIQLRYDREVVFARAEAQRLDIELQLAALRRTELAA